MPDAKGVIEVQAMPRHDPPAPVVVAVFARHGRHGPGPGTSPESGP